ncbi:hypothetical protein BHE74_00050707 [Ensete ventricosum]|nr:hypothetical protein BHE74_00050707 [Ensete ventricosum]
MVSQRHVFRVCTLNLVLDEGPGHQHMGAVYTIEGEFECKYQQVLRGDLIIERYDQSGLRVDCFSAYIYLRELGKSEDKTTLVVKGAEKVENVEANSKYQNKAKRHRPENFIRLVSMSFLSR